ncbi:MAG TPA: glycosyltransferase family 2 protein, partial [Candidatus Acidoferrales bacterium]|nr:glycosyltransferase family 2 protein [Candidatus Acidoferrales bacterium]
APDRPHHVGRVVTPSLRESLATLGPLCGWPLVSIVLAVRNEARHIQRALDSVSAQDWPYGRLEILVVDGGSTDGTIAIVDRFVARDPRVRRLANPAGHVAAGLNAGLAAARGDVVVRVDGHCRVPANYVRAGVEALRAGLAECAGGPVRTLGEGFVGRAIALAMSTPFGVGGARFRWAREAGEVDHVPFGVWRREVFERLGGFDPALVRNQDDEFSDRLRRAGGRIRLLPGAAVDYWCRSSLPALARQYFGYGFWKVRVIRRRGGWPSSPRHLAPAALLLALVLGSALALGTGRIVFALAAPGLEASFLAVATLVTLARKRDASALLLPAAIATMHLAYGAGFLLACRPGAGRAVAGAPLAIGAASAAPVHADSRAA